MKAKNIILIAVISLISFSASFMAFWLIRKNIRDAQAADELAMAQEQEQVNPVVQDLSEKASDLFATPQPPSSLTEEQLRTYIYDIREQMTEHQHRLNLIKSKEQQLRTAQEMIDKDVKELENLRIELAAMVSNIKSEQQQLHKDILEISKIEKDNLVSIAATYDKMDSASASKIVMNMCKLYSKSNTNSGMDDAVKILKYMTERTKAKLLAELANNEPALASAICKRLKYTVEKG